MNKHVNSGEYFAIMPIDILYSKELTANQKILYCIISQLCNNKGYAWANNEYLAEATNRSISSISHNLAILRKLGFIEIEIFKNRKNQIIDRKIYLKETYTKKDKLEKLDKNLSQIKQKVSENLYEIFDLSIAKNCNTYCKKLQYPIAKNCKSIHIHEEYNVELENERENSRVHVHDETTSQNEKYFQKDNLKLKDNLKAFRSDLKHEDIKDKENYLEAIDCNFKATREPLNDKKDFNFQMLFKTQAFKLSKEYLEALEIKINEYCKNKPLAMTFKEFIDRCNMNAYAYANFLTAYESWNSDYELKKKELKQAKETKETNKPFVKKESVSEHNDRVFNEWVERMKFEEQAGIKRDLFGDIINDNTILAEVVDDTPKDKYKKELLALANEMINDENNFDEYYGQF